jgi:hypothetical protein
VTCPRAPLPRTKLEAPVPHGIVSGEVRVSGSVTALSGWRGTVGHNWGSEHADSWVWLHADELGDEPDDWLELVLARVRAGPALTLRRPDGDLDLAADLCAYEYGTAHATPGIEPRTLPHE